MIPRYVGIDVHKNFVVVAAVDANQQVVLRPQRVEMTHFAAWVRQHIANTDHAVIEVTNNAWSIYDILCRQTDHVVVANAFKTKLIAEARIKNDQLDALTLAQLLAAQFIYEVWVPDSDVRQNRILTTHRATLQKQRTQVKNRIHALLGRHNLKCPENSPFTQKGRQWLESLDLSTVERLQLRHLLWQLDLLEEEFDETDRLIARQSASDPRIVRLMQVTGISYYTAFGVLAFIGQVERFPSPDRLASYAGLVPSLHQSGSHSYKGRITRVGHPLLRWLMTEAARNVVRYEPYWQQVYQRICRRRGSNIAIVAIARRLLVVIWHLLKNQSTYHHLRPQTFARKLQSWAFRIGRQHLPAASSKDFVLDRLRGLGLTDLAASLISDTNGRLVIQAM